MKKIDFKKISFGKIDINNIDDRTLLLNLYITQLLTLLVGVIIVFFQKSNMLVMFQIDEGRHFWLWGIVFALCVLGADLLVSRLVPKEVTDDGGVNERLFGNRPLWHIALLSLIVSICEELLFRGAIQHAWGPYWTSILFAAIHIRYLQHWLMTGMVFSISYGLGWIYVQTGTIWTPIVAHFTIDFIMGCILRYGKEDAEG